MGPDALPPGAAVARPVDLLSSIAAGAPPIASWSTVTRPCLVLGRSADDTGARRICLLQARLEPERKGMAHVHR